LPPKKSLQPRAKKQKQLRLANVVPVLVVVNKVIKTARVDLD
jgi:hypothetical protein